MQRLRSPSLALLASLLGAALAQSALAAGCGSGDDGSTFKTDQNDASAVDATITEVGNLSETSLPDGNVVYGDFGPPIVVGADGGAGGAPPSAPTLFGPPGQGAQSGGPCLIEPEVGSLYPRNWLRPRFRWIAANGENLFELRLHVKNQSTDLVVYTSDTSWTMPSAMWGALRVDSPDVEMTVSIRGAVWDGTKLQNESLGSSGPLGIAPVDAPGTIVYWTTSGGSALKGFTIGDESVTPVLVPSQVQEETVTCVGCHMSTPDGKYASFTVSLNSWSNALASVEQGTQGAAPPWLGAGGKAAVEQTYRGINTFSPAHFAQGDRVEIVHDANAELTWIDLEAADPAKASGVLARTSDPRHAGAPTWSHDGSTIVYVSTDANKDGRLDNGPADLYSIPYANRVGGTATPIPGASDPNIEEYYPVFSPDDAWLAFDRIPANNNMYNQPLAEVYVIPKGGGTATRLDANDPPACTSKVSPGVTNSWPKWAPEVGKTGDGRSFYWLVFSSVRGPKGNPQLYITPVVVDASGAVKTYHALYLWNQPESENNHTPAWDVFKIPPPPPPR